MSTHAKLAHDHMARHFVRPDERDAHLKALKVEVQRLSDAAVGTDDHAERARLLSEFAKAQKALASYAAKTRP